jgi:site-specific DNA-methyltransferase (cytosine-N4-specific)
MDGLAAGCAVDNDDGWDFSDARPDALANLHPYPAKFIPQIPHRLIRLFPPQDGLPVFDPFCGSGTSLVEAQNLGFEALGVDLNPIATLMARVKTSPLPAGTQAALSEVVATALRANRRCVPDIPRLDHWFLPAVQPGFPR